ncbi:putative NADPH dehydrogenase C23G7.10c [Glomus cerebriforme]|uniref:Putative NADPH dehydrogenase C23G7.10c n=1 Tax=Glomus cerebriforme TaxID=658196 RepID=A0A397SN69_9GLOM|nr:putative NADPH dehydrogenase C23G7.10c [Glomus cerebriforme]
MITKITGENIGAPNAPYYTPIQDPPPGTSLSLIKSQSNDTESPPLFTPLKLRGISLPNRIVVSPMCTYSAHDGTLTDWHLVHLGQFALRGVGLIFVEATAVTPQGRISPNDSGLWKDEQIAPLKRIVDFVHSQGVKIGIQLAHSGRKSSTIAPFILVKGHENNVKIPNLSPEEYGGWPNDVVGPSPIPWDENHANPKELTIEQIHEIEEAYVAAAKRAEKAGFDIIELHFAHGYLAHEFFSPISNKRTDQYGGSFENRVRYGLETTKKVRQVWSEDKPLFVRISASDWVDNGEGNSWEIKQSVKLSKLLKELGVDLIDVSSGGNTPEQKINLDNSYQVPFAEEIKKYANIYTGAVGLIRDPQIANNIVTNGQADLIFLARGFLHDSSWVIKAAEKLGVLIQTPKQYHYAIKKILISNSIK